MGCGASKKDVIARSDTQPALKRVKTVTTKELNEVVKKMKTMKTIAQAKEAIEPDSAEANSKPEIKDDEDYQKLEPFYKFEYEQITKSPNFAQATGYRPSHKAFNALCAELMNWSGKENRYLFELRLIVGQLGLLHENDEEGEKLMTWIQLMEENVELCNKLYGENAPQLAEVYDCIGSECKDQPEIVDVQIFYLQKALAIKQKYQPGPEHGRTYSQLAFRYFLRGEESAAQEHASIAIDLLQADPVNYLKELMIAITFVGNHAILSEGTRKKINSKQGLLKEKKEEIEFKVFMPERVEAQVALSKFGEILKECLKSIKNKGIINEANTADDEPKQVIAL